MAITKKDLLSCFSRSVLNDHNLDLLKGLLREEYEHTYQEWEEKAFDINHLFSLEERVYRCRSGVYRYKSTLLHLVVGEFCPLEEKKKLIRYLLDKGADVNALDSCGKTPLHNSHDKEVTQILLDADANPFIKNDYGRTVRDCAYNKEIRQLLKKAEDKYKYKAMGVGAICGVIAGLAVGGGLFAAGVALPILAIIGIAVAAALVTGLISGSIATYVVLNPSNDLNNVDASQQVTTGANASV